MLKMQLMDRACVPNDKSNLPYSNGTSVTIISYQWEAEIASWLITAFVIGASTARLYCNDVLCNVFRIKDKAWLLLPHSQRYYFSVLVFYFFWGGGGGGVGLINLSDPSVLQARVSNGLPCLRTRDWRIAKPLPT
jgi:hypothetical protein